MTWLAACLRQLSFLFTGTVVTSGVISIPDGLPDYIQQIEWKVELL